MCGGATVFNALHHHGVTSTDRVGVIGVGGLGHLAIQFAAKMGCGVVVFSGSDSKKEEAKKLGAEEFYAFKGVKTGEELLTKMGGRKVDVLMVTASQQPDWEVYQGVIENGGMILVSLPSPPPARGFSESPANTPQPISSILRATLHALYSNYRTMSPNPRFARRRSTNT